jgi:UDP-N-acetylglucosamine diphosphorylase / glucose-1-phosphate thymidylyltransferase / UDP-N-acetylgalactosamine diphosphorylase / glucosamine-1-phosphate N-acetyltransferase / galactosamine-1-phosphate N-acetyltransferase
VNLSGKNKKIKLIMPMAGEGSRFRITGYSDEPKPFIPVLGKPMFQHVVENLGIEFDEMIFIVQARHGIRDRVLALYPDAHVIELAEPTQGAADTVLRARSHYDDGSAIFIANCDQHVVWDSSEVERVLISGADGSIAVFASDGDPKWSYALTDGVRVTRVAEKDPISEWATVGFYSWSDGREFVRAAEAMMAVDDRVRGEFYLCPVYNYSIAAGKHIVAYTVSEMQGIGTPEDLELWLKSQE